jgi:membrane associated rhomboid family serine protease
MRLALPPLTPVIKALVIANVALWIVTAISANIFGSGWLIDLLALRPADFFGGRVWQPFTYMWLHSLGGTGHLLGNMLMLYLFGAQLELDIGRKRILQIYVLTGFAGAMLVVFSALFWKMQPFSVAYLQHSWGTVTVGASGAVAGIMAAWCGLYWGERRNFLFVGLIKVQSLFYFLVALDLLASLAADNVSSACHLGGLFSGVCLTRYNMLPRFEEWRRYRKARSEQADLDRIMNSFELIQGGRSDDDDDQEYIH